MENKFALLQPYLAQILLSVKKDLKNEHLVRDRAFFKLNFGSKPLQRISTEELLAAYEKELLKGNFDLGEYIVSKWVMKNAEIYNYFAEKLTHIDPNFADLKELSKENSLSLAEGAGGLFGYLPTYLFSVLNCVVLHPEVLTLLGKKAEQESKAESEAKQKKEDQMALEQLLQRQEREMARLTEKYEKRLAGIEKKYFTDTELLKDKIRALELKVKA